MKSIVRSAQLACVFILSLATPCQGEVKQSSPSGFLIQATRDVDLPASVAYEVFTRDFSKWYDASHSYGGKAENLSLDFEKHCMLEKLPDGGFVRHMEIVFHQPGKMLRMTGGLGPLQGMGVSGAWTFSFSETDGITTVAMTYSVSGAQHLLLEKIAGPVDGVLTSQLDRFEQHCVKLSESK
ncbi:MAG: SRPBCC family protein [Planctomycetota bacterium]